MHNLVYWLTFSLDTAFWTFSALNFLTWDIFYSGAFSGGIFFCTSCCVYLLDNWKRCIVYNTLISLSCVCLLIELFLFIHSFYVCMSFFLNFLRSGLYTAWWWSMLNLTSVFWITNYLKPTSFPEYFHLKNVYFLR